HGSVHLQRPPNWQCSRPSRLPHRSTWRRSHSCVRADRHRACRICAARHVYLREPG
ncbi:hypothetical protein LDENG_00116940, partial [Lucifuga dentata]